MGAVGRKVKTTIWLFSEGYELVHTMKYKLTAAYTHKTYDYPKPIHSN
jgi:hypothetical protein